MARGGRRIGSGRKPKADEMECARLFDKAWPVADRLRVIRKMNSKALSGDSKAAALLFAYVYGKPTEKHEHTGENGGPLEIVVSYVTKPAKD